MLCYYVPNDKEYWIQLVIYNISFNSTSMNDKSYGYLIDFASN